MSEEKTRDMAADAGQPEENPVKAAVPAKKKMSRETKRKIRNTILGVLLLTALGGGGYAYAKYRQTQKAAEAKKSTVNTGKVRRGDITQKISSTGTIEPKDTYTITALVTGTIVEADFAEGDQVEKGQVLYRVDAHSVESELQSDENSLNLAEKKLSRAKQDYAEAQAKYGSGVYTATQAGYITKIHVVDGQKVGNGTNLLELTDETKMEVQIPFLSGESPLIKAGAEALLTLSDTGEQITGTVVAVGDREVVLEGGRLVRYVTIEAANPGGLTDTTAVSANIAGFDCVEEGIFEPIFTSTMAADLDSSVECVQVLVHVGDYISPGTPIFSIASNSIRDILYSFEDKVDSQSSSVDSARQRLDSATENLDKYTITAPIEGRVISKNYKVGDKIGNNSGQSNSSTSLATIYDMSEYTFRMSIDETDITRIEVGQEVEVSAEAFDGENFSGTVTGISLESSVSNGVSTYPVEVTMSDTDKLLPGMNVDAEIVIDSAKDALLIPADALMRGNRVYVQDETVTEAEGSVPAGFRAVKVETGLVNDDYVQIVSGELEEDDVVYIQESSTQTNMWGGMGGPGGMGGMGGMGGNQGGGSRGGNSGGGRGGNSGGNRSR